MIQKSSFKPTLSVSLASVLSKILTTHCVVDLTISTCNCNNHFVIMFSDPPKHGNLFNCGGSPHPFVCYRFQTLPLSSWVSLLYLVSRFQWLTSLRLLDLELLKGVIVSLFSSWFQWSPSSPCVLLWVGVSGNEDGDLDASCPSAHCSALLSQRLALSCPLPFGSILFGVWV